MRIAIIGPAGSGKSTFAEQLARWLRKPCSHAPGPEIVYVNCDAFVDNIYREDDYDSPIMRFIRKSCPNCWRSTCYPVDKRVLGLYLCEHPKERTRLEDLIFTQIREYIRTEESEEDVVIVDGLLPRFLKKLKFDVVLYVHTDPAERKRRLRKRGVNPERIADIACMQKNMFRDPILFQESK